MKNRLCCLIYFVFLFALFIFLKFYSQENEVIEIISHSYLLFLQIINRFSLIMAVRGWRRLF